MRRKDCKRCGSPLDNGICSDQTCPFSSHGQSCPVGWTGHPNCPFGDRDAAREDCKCPPMTDEDRMRTRGARLARELGLKPALKASQPYDPPRWSMGKGHGTKTAVGVYQTVERLWEENRMDNNGKG